MTRQSIPPSLLTGKRILFIGLGFMLSLILEYLLRTYPEIRSNSMFTRRSRKKAEIQAEKYGIDFSLDNMRAIDSFEPDIIFLGIPPKNLTEVVLDLKNATHTSGHIICITASAPLFLLHKALPSSHISVVLPDDTIDSEDPQSIVLYCTNRESDDLVTLIFAPTCKRLEKLDPDDMCAATTVLCQGNPLLSFGIATYDGPRDTFESHIRQFFTKINQKISSGQFSDEITDQLAKGYLHHLENYPLKKDLFKKILLLITETMANREETYNLAQSDLRRLMGKWATTGGYEERGFQIVDEFLNTSRTDYMKLPALLLDGMLERGKMLEEKIRMDFRKNSV